jgi:branched-subunit amino acid aminotransferase/4-amino-4-deoxychorismate lyase
MSLLSFEIEELKLDEDDEEEEEEVVCNNSRVIIKVTL